MKILSEYSHDPQAFTQGLIFYDNRADIGLPVVKVIVPGLRHFWPRFAPGRLYDVPYKLGWLPEPLSEEQLNSIILLT